MADFDTYSEKRIRSICQPAAASAAARAILALAAAAALPGAPAASEQGYTLKDAQWLHLYPTITGGAPSWVIKPWYWSSISAKWHPGANITLTDDAIVQVQVNGEERLYIQVISRVAPADTIQLHAGVNGY